MSWLVIRKIGPWIAIALLSVLLWQTHGASKAKSALIDTLETQVEADVAMLTAYSKALRERDIMLADQSAAINQLKQQSEADRAEYEANLANARADADEERERADDLLSLTPPEGELAQCRAARDLLEKELTND